MEVDGWKMYGSRQGIEGTGTRTSCLIMTRTWHTHTHTHDIIEVPANNSDFNSQTVRLSFLFVSIQDDGPTAPEVSRRR
jgi:hypothetical protein